MDKAEELLIEKRKKIREKITNLEIRMEVLQDNLDDTKSVIRELKEIFIKIEKEWKERKLSSLSKNIRF